MTLAMRDQQTQGWMASVVFHAMLLMVFLLLGVSFEDRTESFAEMLFLETGPPPASGPVEDALGRPLSTAPLPPESATLVDLPRRDATDLPPEEILPVPARRETAVAERQPASVVDRLTRTGLERPPADVGLQQGNKVAPPTGNPAGDIPPIEGAAASGAGTDRPFQIQWLGSQREIVRSILPEVPGGVERDMELRFQFGVTPAGEVTAIAPLQKGEPALEEAALTALRQWKFQPLPQESPQENQVAVITFRFRIRLA